MTSPTSLARAQAGDRRGKRAFLLKAGDFEFRSGRIFLRKTGNSAALDLALVREVVSWLTFIFVVRLRGWLARLSRGAGPAIHFTPDVPHPRYMIRAAMFWAGLPVARAATEAQACFSFEDSTSAMPTRPPLPRSFNFGCIDIGKSHVANVFADVFGYKLLIDPRRWTGEAVEKSEINGAHDGRVVHCPCEPEPGKSYQRLIDNVDDAGLAVDLRVHCIGRRPVLVWIKRREVAARFLPPNRSAELCSPLDAFSTTELSLIAAFVARMEADWCALDILRDRDGRIYIVDVNKTDAGPVVALPFRQKLRSVAILADALTEMVEKSKGQP